MVGMAAVVVLTLAPFTTTAPYEGDAIDYEREFVPYESSIDQYKGESYYDFLEWCYEKKGGTARFGDIDSDGTVGVVYCDLPNGTYRVFPIPDQETRTQR
jgi:hypothetical protein